MKRLSTALLAAAAAVAILALAVPPATSAGEEADAKALFVETHKCNMCHGVAAAGIEAKTTSDKMKGPDLSGFKSDKDLAELAAFMRKENEGEQHKKGFKGTDEELQAILDWLGSLEAQE